MTKAGWVVGRLKDYQDFLTTMSWRTYIVVAGISLQRGMIAA
jgi:hypothetical protein